MYIPDSGDVVWINFNPQLGREQAGRRPALILSPLAYNKKSGLAVLCPITNQAKGYLFEVKIPDDSEVSGVVLSDQIKSLSWEKRDAEFKCKIDPDTHAEVLERIGALLGFDELYGV